MGHKCIDLENKKGLSNDNPYSYVVFFALFIPTVVFVPGFILKIILILVAWVFSQFFVRGSRRDAIIGTIYLVTAGFFDSTVRDEKMYDPEMVDEIKVMTYNPHRQKKKSFLE